MSTIVSSALFADHNALIPPPLKKSHTYATLSPTLGTSPLQIVLTRFIANLLDNPYCSDGLDDAVNGSGDFDPARIRPQRIALSKALIQFNGPRRIAYLIFDIDKPDGALRWQDTNAPAPNLVMSNPTNGHAHVVYELSDPIWLRDNPDDPAWLDRPVHYLECVKKALGDNLGADQHYTGMLTKNPLRDDKWKVWSFREQPYRLAELHQHIDVSHPLRSRRERSQTTDGRDTTLFDETRFWAYQHRDDYHTYEDFKDAVAEVVEGVNDGFDQPFAQYGRLKSVIKSVARWVWNVYRPGTKPKERLSEDEITRRQQQAGERTRQTCNDDTITRLRSAIGHLVEHGLPTTHSGIAKQAGMARQTVIRYGERVAMMVRDAVSFTGNFKVARKGGYPEAGTPLLHPQSSSMPSVSPPGEPANDNRNVDQPDDMTSRIRQAIQAIERSKPSPTSQAKTQTIVTALRNARKPAKTTPTYQQVLIEANHNMVKTAAIVFKHAMQGRLVVDLPESLSKPACRLMLNHVVRQPFNDRHDHRVAL